MLAKHNTKVIFSIILVLLLTIIAGCARQDAQKKPGQDKIADPNSLSEEVKRYNQEPTISLYRTDTGKTENLKLEEYVKGVVAAEIGSKFPMEALKAQAIVARTMTLTLLEYEGGTRSKYNTDASDDHKEFQAYDNKRITDEISKAVDATRGQVLVNNGKFIYAMFHSVSKDKTADVTESFPELQKRASYLVPVATNGINVAPEKYRQWTVKVNKAEIAKIMGIKSGILNNIIVSSRGPSGRAMGIYANNGEAVMSGVDFRKAIGYDKLYSTYITNMTIQGNDVVIEGSGWGHGAGMEQWGAYAMAKQGKSAREIIEYYYPQAQWTQLYN